MLSHDLAGIVRRISLLACLLDLKYWSCCWCSDRKDGEVANSTDGSPKVFRSEIALGRLRLDGAVSMNGPYGRAGNLTTKPLLFRGKKLFLNCDASGGGAIIAFIHSAQSGELLLGPSAPVVHSSVRAEVQWNRDLAHSRTLELLAGAGEPVVLTLSIEEAELYSFQFAG